MFYSHFCTGDTILYTDIDSCIHTSEVDKLPLTDFLLTVHF